MYRAYNGYLYQQGVKLSLKTQKSHKGDVLSFEVVHEEICGETSRSLYLSINGRNRERIFTHLPAVNLYPTVIFYGKGRSVELIRCSVPTCFTKYSGIQRDSKVVRESIIKSSKFTSENPTLAMLTFGWHFGECESLSQLLCFSFYFNMDIFMESL
jgi:hypothetical protein